MAKYITYIAVLANIIIALWLYAQPGQLSIEDQIKEIPANKHLVLLSELEQKTHEPEQTQLETLSLPEIEIIALKTPEVEQNNDEPTDAEVETAQAADERVVDLTNDDNQEKSAEKINICYTVGPFLLGKEANKVGKLMQDRVLIVSRREKKEQVVDGYRVYIKPLPSREEAAAVTRELADLGILDFFIINKKEHRNGISLGLFQQKSGAIRRMAQIRRFNFNVAMEARQRETQVYWLDVTDENNNFTQQFWNEIKETQAQLQRLNKKC